jgi:8-oxo-dGTP pyrophosphatase MutT (NUDIX family)
MKIETSWTSKRTGKKVVAFYEDTDSFDSLPAEKIKSVCAFCIYNNKFVIVKNEGNWEPVAGHVEPGESLEESLIREVKEESNMNIIRFYPIGYLYTYDQDIYQARYLCIVEPYGPFVSDPDGGVTEIKIIDMAEIKSYFNWGEVDERIKDRISEIIKENE